MSELLRHFIVFFTLFIVIRLKLKSWIWYLFITLPLIGELIQLHPLFQKWEFTFEWGDVLLNYTSALTGWMVVAAIREDQKIRYKNYISLRNKMKIMTMFSSLFIVSCLGNEPYNLTTREKYEADSKWCTSYGMDPTFHRYKQTYTETYQECMERLGYKFRN